ncbi:MAG: hypothetical protein UV80_C0005G0031 [Candidatus Peregrinibacteria bacterium GW2011_GWF2_43_17]|nr:MAG: hypothetical protein UV80_C0005G0031 [Candidatus Peregrinibacteria bacterium GW2011_GWF2_43_17]KKT19656.1 MAG: methyltransferase domain protein [Candidatus Peregrinibacteria bacterium GW2011_GWA2_43_8]HAU40052.1 hypothetical protein [Candidatus Peregrinibacteria bacterium]
MNPKKFFENCLKEIAKEKVIVDVGGGTPFQKDMAQYRDWFANSKYLTVDQAVYSPSIVGDVHNLPLEDNYADAAICKAVLEHCYNPIKVADEIFRILKKGGKLLVWLPFFYPYHGNKNYKDYYRYSQDGVRYLFRDFAHVEIVQSKGYFETLFGFLPVVGRLSFLFKPLDSLIKIGNCQSGFYVYCTK